MSVVVAILAGIAPLVVFLDPVLRLPIASRWPRLLGLGLAGGIGAVVGAAAAGLEGAVLTMAAGLLGVAAASRRSSETGSLWASRFQPVSRPFADGLFLAWLLVPAGMLAWTLPAHPRAEALTASVFAMAVFLPASVAAGCFALPRIRSDGPSHSRSAAARLTRTIQNTTIVLGGTVAGTLGLFLVAGPGYYQNLSDAAGVICAAGASLAGVAGAVVVRGRLPQDAERVEVVWAAYRRQGLGGWVVVVVFVLAGLAAVSWSLVR
jgi:hypothetical protein